MTSIVPCNRVPILTWHRFKELILSFQAETLFCQGGRSGVFWYYWSRETVEYYSKTDIRGEERIMVFREKMHLASLMVKFLSSRIGTRSGDTRRLNLVMIVCINLMLEKRSRKVTHSMNETFEPKKVFLMCWRPSLLSDEDPNFIDLAIELASTLRHTIFLDQVNK